MPTLTHPSELPLAPSSASGSAERQRALALCLLVVACSGGPSVVAREAPSSGPLGSSLDAFDVPVQGLPDALSADFNDGDVAFGTPMREPDGLGPLYTRAACDSCHSSAVRGPGLVQKMSVVDADGVTPLSDQSELHFGHTVHPLVAAGARTPILPPLGDAAIRVSIRVGPPLLGRGYMEAVDDSEILRVEGEQAARSDGIHGRANHVVYASESSADERFHTHRRGDQAVGRFGLKARVATLDDFTADALQSNMGITSPLRPTELANPDGLLDDRKPGIDVGLESVASRTMYVRLLAIPERRGDERGVALLEEALCAVCHVPALHTRADYPVPQLAGIDARVYKLADGLPTDPGVDGEAGSLEWRTAPLIGLRFNRTYLHDSRAKTVEDAVLMHRGEGSEANVSIDRLDSLSAADRQTLLEFVEAL